MTKGGKKEGAAYFLREKGEGCLGEFFSEK